MPENFALHAWAHSMLFSHLHSDDVERVVDFFTEHMHHGRPHISVELNQEAPQETCAISINCPCQVAGIAYVRAPDYWMTANTSNGLDEGWLGLGSLGPLINWQFEHRDCLGQNGHFSISRRFRGARLHLRLSCLCTRSSDWLTLEDRVPLNYQSNCKVLNSNSGQILTLSTKRIWYTDDSGATHYMSLEELLRNCSLIENDLETVNPTRYERLINSIG